MEWKDFVPALNDKCLCLTPFCDEAEVSAAPSESTRRIERMQHTKTRTRMGMTTTNRCVLIDGFPG